MSLATVQRIENRRRAVTALVASELVADVARALGSVGIPVMPVKGALLQHWLYRSPHERPLSDVDLLVPPRRFAQAVLRLESRGYRRAAGSGVGAVVMETPFALALDLHPTLFDRARYRFPTEALFARSVVDDTLYGTRVCLPSELDVYAHLVGKVASDHLDARAEVRLRELGAMGARLDASPGAAAEHLVRCGMPRAARYVLPLVAAAAPEDAAFAQEALDRLPPDPVGWAIAHAAHRTLPRLAPTSAVGAAAAHLLNESVARGLASGTRAAFQRARRGSRGSHTSADSA